MERNFHPANIHPVQKISEPLQVIEVPLQVIELPLHASVLFGFKRICLILLWSEFFLPVSTSLSIGVIAVAVCHQGDDFSHSADSCS